MVQFSGSTINRAIEDYTQAIDSDPQAPSEILAMIYANRGAVRSANGDYALAIEDLTEALRLNAALGGVYLNRGHLFAAIGDHRRAIADFSEAIRIDPNNAGNYQARAEAYRALGDEQNAAKDDHRAQLRNR